DDLARRRCGIGEVLDLEAGIGPGAYEAGCTHAGHRDGSGAPSRTSFTRPDVRARARMRVAITGATGNVGTALVAALAGDPGIDEIVGIARSRPSQEYPLTRFFKADVSDGDLDSAFAGADAVVHLAWEIQPSRQRNRLWRTNVL